MLSPRAAAFAFIPLVSIAMSAVISFVLTALNGFNHGNFAVAWMQAWGSALMVALPAAWVLVPAIRAGLARLTRPVIVPSKGVKIP